MSKPRRLSLIIFSLAFSIASSPLAAIAQQNPGQQDKPVRLKTDLVQVRAVVTDRHGQIVSNLKREDFELLENGQSQEISFFSVEEAASQSGTDKTTAAENKTRAPENVRAATAPPARTIVLFVDTIHMVFENLARTKEALKRFVNEQMTDNDLVALVTSSASLGLMEQFTRDRNMLRLAIDRLNLWRVPPQETLMSPYLAAQITKGDREAIATGGEILKMEEHLEDPSPVEVRARAASIIAEASYRRRVSLATLKGVVDRVAELPGQRMIVMFSEGFTLYSPGGGIDGYDITQTTSRAVRAGVVIYSIASQGLRPVMVPATLPGIMEGRAGRRMPRGGSVERPVLTTYLLAADKDLENALSAVAKDTGGEVFFNSNDLSARLKKVLDDNRVYYALAYYAPAKNSSDGARPFNRITLRVKNHPDYKIRTQRGYQLLPAEVEEQAATPRQRLVQAMHAALPVSTIPVAASADYIEIEGDPHQVSVQLYIDANSIQYREQDNASLFNLDVALAVYDVTGKRVNVITKEVQGSFSAERLAAARRSGYRYSERLQLKPGVYQIRAGVLEPATGRVGTASAWVEVPDLTKGKLNLSYIMLVREPDAEEQAARTATAIESMSPAATQGIRAYKRGEPVEYHMMIYPPSGDPLVIQTQIMKGEQVVYETAWRDVASRAIRRDRKGIEVAEAFRLNNPQAGVYELRVTVKEPKSKKPAQRATLFAIEP